MSCEVRTSAVAGLDGMEDRSTYHKHDLNLTVRTDRLRQSLFPSSNHDLTHLTSGQRLDQRQLTPCVNSVSAPSAPLRARFTVRYAPTTTDQGPRLGCRISAQIERGRSPGLARYLSTPRHFAKQCWHCCITCTRQYSIASNFATRNRRGFVQHSINIRSHSSYSNRCRCSRQPHPRQLPKVHRLPNPISQ